MLVKNWMSRKVITIDSLDSIQDAIKLLKEHHIRMLPVMKKGKLVGIVTDRDLKEAYASDVTTLEIHELLYLVSKIRVSEIMSKNPITIPFDYSVEECAEILLKNKISGAPVVDYNGNIVGTITQTDLFKVLVSVTGLSTRGILFAFNVEDRPGAIKEIDDIIRRYGGRMAGILSSHQPGQQGYRKVYIRMYNIDRSKLSELKKKLQKKASLLYMLDHQENKREIYVDEQPLGAFNNEKDGG